MANVVINSTSEVRLYESRIIAQVENNSVIYPMIGEVSDMNSLIYKPSDMHKHGRYVTVPLRKAVTDAAIEDDDTLEGQGKKSIVSTTDIEINMRSQVFGGQHVFEELKTILDLREMHYQEAEQWATNDFDYKALTTARLAYASLPDRSARGDSQYNVDFCAEADDWGSLGLNTFITAKDIARAKLYFMANRGIRPARIGGGKMGYILILPAEATYALAQEDLNFQAMLKDAMPRSEDHIFFKGHGLNPWGYYDGVYIIEDQRPVYGADTNRTHLITEDVSDGGFIRFEGIFMGAQALAYYEWERLTWFERIWDHNHKFEVSISRTFSFAKPVINLGTLASASNRDYGIGYLCGSAPRNA